MIHLRIVAPRHQAERALELLEGSDSVCNVVYLADTARRPKGDVILADVAREDASVVISDLRELGIAEDGSISLEHRHPDLEVRRARGRARAGRPRGRRRVGGGRKPVRARASSSRRRSSRSW